MGININILEGNELGGSPGTVDETWAKKLFKAVQDLKGMAINLTHDSTQAEDLLGDVTLKLLPKQDTYSETWNLRGRVARTIYRTFLDGERQKPNVSLEDIPVLPNLSIWWWEMSWPEHASFRDFKEVMGAIGELPDTMKEPFMLYLEGIDYKDIPEALGDPDRKQNTVRSQIHKARKAIRWKFPDLFKLYAPNPKWGKK